jgi:hypothetical protein
MSLTDTTAILALDVMDNGFRDKRVTEYEYDHWVFRQQQWVEWGCFDVIANWSVT